MEGTRKRQKERSLARGLNSNYLEDEDEEDEGEISIAAIKKRYKSNRGGLKVKLRAHWTLSCLLLYVSNVHFLCFRKIVFVFV